MGKNTFFRSFAVPYFGFVAFPKAPVERDSELYTPNAYPAPMATATEATTWPVFHNAPDEGSGVFCVVVPLFHLREALCGLRYDCCLA